MAEKIIDIIKNALRNTTVKNGLWMYMLQFFNVVIPVVTIPYVTRVLGAGKYGVFSIALNLINYFQVIVEYGFSMSCTRKIVLGKQDESKLFSTVLQSRFLLFGFCIVISAVYMLFKRSDTELCLCLLLLLITIFGNCMDMSWFFQGKQDMKFIAIINVLARTVSMVLTLLLVKKPSDILLYCVLYSVSPFLSGILGIIISMNKFSLHLQRVTFDDIRRELEDGWYVFTTQFASKVFGAVGITFLGFFAAAEEVGIYSAIIKIPNTLVLIWVPVSQVLYPVSSKKFNEAWSTGKDFVNQMRRYVLPVIIFVVAVVIIFSKQIVGFLFGPEYMPKFYWLIPQLIYMIMAVENSFNGIQTLLASGNDKRYSRCFQFGVAFTVAVNFLLIFLFKGDGAACAPLISEIFLNILLRREIGKCNALAVQ